MKLQIIHTTDDQLEGRTFETGDPIITDGTVTLDNGVDLRIDKSRDAGMGLYRYSNPNYVAVAREV